MHPKLMAALPPRDKIWKQPTGKSAQAWTTGCGTHTQGKGTSHPRRRKECHRQRHGRTQGGAQEAKPVRQRKTDSTGIPSRRKLKVRSHQLTEKRDTDSHAENPLGVPTGETSDGNPSGAWFITDILTYRYENRPPRGPTGEDGEPYPSPCTAQADGQSA